MEVQITTAVARVLRAMLDDPEEPRYGMELMKTTGMASGSLYPILTRLERAGWVTGNREDIDPATEGRPARRYYTLTGEGAHSAHLALAELHHMTRVPAPRGRLLGRPADERG